MQNNCGETTMDPNLELYQVTIDSLAEADILNVDG
jgi:hypothetical protein